MLSESNASDDLEPVNLGRGDTPDAAAAAVVTDPWAMDESSATATGAGTAGDDYSTAATGASSTTTNPADRAEAISKLKVSSQRLASNLDTKLGLSQAWDKIGTSVKTIDKKTNVSSTVKSAGSTIGNWFSVVDQQFQISATSKGIGSSIAAIVPTEEIATGLATTTRALHEFDESHGITKTTAATLAGGADYLTNTIAGSAKDADGGAREQDVDADGLPSSFQK
jgi:hypothetical protein